MIPYGKQIISSEDIDAVVQALQSPLITQGPIVHQFEKAVASYCGASFAVGVNSGTAALHISCLALGIGPEDEVWTSPVTFVASANCALYCGATVDFVDVEYQTGNMSAQALEKKLKTAVKIPKAVIVVHLAGLSADMQKIRQLSKEYGFYVIEDACHALGGEYQGSKIGSCRYSDITVFSFHPVKAITTAEGGMALTCNEKLAEKLRLFGCHGITRDPELMENIPEGDWYYEQLELGYNYRLPEINAALGLSQLKKLDQWIAIRNKYADFYFDHLSSLPLELPARYADRRCAYHLFIIKVDASRRKKVFDGLRARGIGTNVHYIPVYHQPYYRKTGRYQPLKEAEAFYQRILTLPLCPALTIEDLHKVVADLTQLL